MSSQPHFDRYAFDGRRVRAVTTASRITFADYGNHFGGGGGGMHVIRNEPSERRLPTAIWSARLDWLRELALVFVENRLYLPAPGALTTARERIARIAQEAQRQADRKQCDLGTLLRAYAITQSPAHREAWARRIQEVDTDVALTIRGHLAVVAATAFLYHRMHWDSVAVAEELALKPPHVRQCLARMAILYDRHFKDGKPLPTAWQSHTDPAKRQCQRRKTCSPVKRAKISARLKGRTFDDAWRRKLSAAARRRSPEWRAAKSAAIKAAWARGVFANRRAAEPAGATDGQG